MFQEGIVGLSLVICSLCPTIEIRLKIVEFSFKIGFGGGLTTGATAGVEGDTEEDGDAEYTTVGPGEGDEEDVGLGEAEGDKDGDSPTGGTDGLGDELSLTEGEGVADGEADGLAD